MTRFKKKKEEEEEEKKYKHEIILALPIADKK